MKTNLNAPLFTCFDVTYRCNLKCIHCCFSEEDTSNRKELSTENVFYLLKELNDLRIFSFQFAGGEPFVRKDFFDIVKESSKYPYVVSIATNGTMIDASTARFLKQCNIKHVQVSLDGASVETHEFIRGRGTFDKTLNGIKSLVDAGIEVSIASVIYKKNIDAVSELCSLTKEYGCTALRLQLLLLQGNAVNNKNELTITRDKLKSIIDCAPKLQQKYGVKIVLPCFAQFINSQSNHILSKVGCGAGVTSININPYGDVTACGILTGQEYSMGNCMSEKISDIWKDEDRWFAWRHSQENVKGKCASCGLLESCRGGCRANALLYTRDFYAEDPLCWR